MLFESETFTLKALGYIQPPGVRTQLQHFLMRFPPNPFTSDPRFPSVIIITATSQDPSRGPSSITLCWLQERWPDRTTDYLSCICNSAYVLLTLDMSFISSSPSWRWGRNPGPLSAVPSPSFLLLLSQAVQLSPVYVCLCRLPELLTSCFCTCPPELATALLPCPPH